MAKHGVADPTSEFGAIPGAEKSGNDKLEDDPNYIAEGEEIRCRALFCWPLKVYPPFKKPCREIETQTETEMR